MRIIALVIGNNNYPDPDKLENAVNDAKSMEDVFCRLGYTVLSGYNCDNKTYGEFNPNRDYFYYNGYGNLVSSDYKDYSAFLDRYAVEKMSENRRYIDAIEENEELTELFDELEESDSEEDDE